MNKPLLKPAKPAIIEQHTATEKSVVMYDLALLTKSTHVQVREDQDPETVTRYAAAYLEAENMPPVVVFEEKRKDSDDRIWLADGHHRVAGAKKAKLAEINAIVKKGDRRAALLYALRANHQNGLPLTNADKHRSVSLMLADEEWRAWSDRSIAEACLVGANLVGKIRKLLPAEQQSTVRKSKDGATRDTKNIGKKAKEAERPNVMEVENKVLEILRNSTNGHKGTLLTEFLTETGLSVLTIVNALDGACDKGLVFERDNDDGVIAYHITHQGKSPTTADTDTEPETLSLEEAAAAEVHKDKPKKENLDLRRLRKTRELLAERFLKDKPQCQAGDKQLVSLALVVGVPVSADAEPWSDALVSRCFSELADRLKIEVADRLNRNDAHRLPSIEHLAGWWGIDIRALTLQAERTVSA
jgi:disulfide oxidoreductase YuzD